MSLKVKIDAFEGPLDLLLQLVLKNELDICELSLAKVTDQFLEIIEEASYEGSIDLASQYSIVVAQLVVIKSRTIFASITASTSIEVTDADEEQGGSPGSEADLIAKLKLYKECKDLGERLIQLSYERMKLSSSRPYDITSYATKKDFLRGITLEQLRETCVDLLKEYEIEDKPPQGFIRREEISVSQRIEEILELLSFNQETNFSALAPAYNVSREYVVSTFLALLELMKLRKVKCKQQSLFSEIYIEHSKREAGV